MSLELKVARRDPIAREAFDHDARRLERGRDAPAQIGEATGHRGPGGKVAGPTSFRRTSSFSPTAIGLRSTRAISERELLRE
jgi:hypothetical protein